MINVAANFHRQVDAKQPCRIRKLFSHLILRYHTPKILKTRQMNHVNTSDFGHIFECPTILGLDLLPSTNRA